MEYDDYPSQDDHFNGLEEEILSFEANQLINCNNCGDLCHPENLQDGICESCWDDSVCQSDIGWTDEYEY